MTAQPRRDITIGGALDWAARHLEEAGVDGARRDAALLLAMALQVERSWMIGRSEVELDAGQLAAFETLIRRRRGREPVSRILGRRGFWTLDLEITDDTLDPRPDTEVLVETVAARLSQARDRRLRILDLGTGSGCILLALLSEFPHAEGLGVDLNPGAVETAARNARTLGLEGRASFRVGNWGQGLDGGWQVIVSNPPYIVNAEIADLAPEVADFDPHLALAGGADGLDCYRALLPDVVRLLAPQGVVALELGQGQWESVACLAEDAGLKVLDRVQDLAGRQRCLVATTASMA